MHFRSMTLGNLRRKIGKRWLVLSRSVDYYFCLCLPLCSNKVCMIVAKFAIRRQNGLPTANLSCCQNPSSRSQADPPTAYRATFAWLGKIHIMPFLQREPEEPATRWLAPGAAPDATAEGLRLAQDDRNPPVCVPAKNARNLGGQFLE